MPCKDIDTTSHAIRSRTTFRAGEGDALETVVAADPTTIWEDLLVSSTRRKT